MALGLLGGGGGTIGGAAVRLVLDSSQFNAGLAQAEGQLKGAAGRMQSLGAGMSRVGGALTRGVTLPIVAAGAVATKMALDFNKAFVQIQTLASSGGHSIAQMKTEVLSLAQSTGQDPNGLAAALYQVLSAGKAAASQAFPILTSAAKGAAIGMGSVSDISKVLITTMNAYGPKAISAGKAMDILTQATHDSAAEADALAGSLGPVIGVAAQVGVKFADVAGAIATATNNGISAERAATGLRFLLQSLAAPTATAKAKLDQYGISLQDLQRMIASQGLVGTLQTLAKTFDLTSTRGQQAWKAVVGGARGAVIANTLVGKSASAASNEVQKLGNVAGVTQQKFELWGKTITGQNAKALGDLKVAAIQLGQQLIPVFEEIVKSVSTLVHWFTSLPQAMQSTIVKGLAIAALAGPFLKLSGIVVSLAGKFAALGKAQEAVAAASGGEQLTLFGGGGAAAAGGGALATLGLGAAAAAVGVGLVAEKIHLANIDTTAWSKVTQNMTTSLINGTKTVGDWRIAISTAANGMQDGAAKADFLKRANLAVAYAAMQAKVATEKVGAAVGGYATNVGDARDEAYSLMRANQGIVQSNGQVGKSAGSASGQVKALGASLGNTAGAENNAMGAAIGLTGAIQKIPTKHSTNVSVNTGNALGEIGAVVGALGRIHDVTSTIHVNTVNTTTSVARHAHHAAAGGIIHGQSGFVTRGPTYMVGEGSYSTFAGPGAEAVIPLNNNTMDRLAKRLNKGSGGHTINLTINTQGSSDPAVLARTVSQEITRVMRNEALV